jgi:hypothetical protein
LRFAQRSGYRPMDEALVLAEAAVLASVEFPVVASLLARM